MPPEQASPSPTSENRYFIFMLGKKLKFLGLLIFLGLLAAGVATATVNVSQNGMHAVNARA
jgi:hypothetical protein